MCYIYFSDILVNVYVADFCILCSISETQCVSLEESEYIPLTFSLVITSFTMFFSVFQGPQGATGNPGEKGLMVNTVLSKYKASDRELKDVSFFFYVLYVFSLFLGPCYSALSVLDSTMVLK